MRMDEIRERPEILLGNTRKVKTGCGSMYVTVNSDEGPIEVFCRLGKAGGCAACQMETTGRLISLALRAKVPMVAIVRQLRGVACHRPAFAGMGKRTLSCSDALAQALEEACQLRKEVDLAELSIAVKQQTHDEVVLTAEPSNFEGCPDCGGTIRFEEGCKKCSCGWTQC